MTALALRDDQTSWDTGQLAVLRSLGIDEDVTEAELNAFLHECQRRKLDPFTRQIYLIGRWDKQKGRKVYRSQTSIDGFRLIARRAADEAKQDIEYEETLWCGSNGKWVDAWLADGPPAACKVVVLRGGKRFPATARYNGYVPLNSRGEPTGLWQKMPDHQISKCSEALALRKAFPEELGSLYTDDEMAQADNPQQNGHHTVTATVVKDDVPPDDVWQTPVLESADLEWLHAALVNAEGFATPADGGKLWKETRERYEKHQITPADSKQLTGMIKARLADLKAAASVTEELAGDTQQVQPADAAEVVEAFIVVEDDAADGLDPEDSWAAKVEDITSLEDAAAALADLNVTLKNATIDEARFKRVEAAIDAKCVELTRAATA